MASSCCCFTSLPLLTNSSLLHFATIGDRYLKLHFKLFLLTGLRSCLAVTLQPPPRLHPIKTTILLTSTDVQIYDLESAYLSAEYSNMGSVLKVNPPSTVTVFP